jgi:hypothetical protein
MLAEARRTDIEARLHDPQSMRRTLARSIQASRAGRNAACPIVENPGGETLSPPRLRSNTRRTVKA